MAYRMVVGLGNPGTPYADTRHNVGFRVVDTYAAKLRATPWKRRRSMKAELADATLPGGGKLLLAKPQTYMNASGESVRKLCSYFKIPPESVVVVYDEINLDVGQIKISLSGSSGGHNGLQSVMDCLNPVFARLRVGIGPKLPKEISLEHFVLGPFPEEDRRKIESRMDACIEALDRLCSEGAAAAMNHVNKKEAQ